MFSSIWSQHVTQTSKFPGADVKSGNIFCSQCDNFIYDAVLDSVFLNTVISAEEKQTRFQGTL
jgi:ubiquitin carboxyl-terminal hydrolase 22/27/51